MKFNVAIQIDRPVNEVFDYVTCADLLFTWQTNTVFVEKQTDGPMGIGTRLHEVHAGPRGREMHSVAEVCTYEPGKCFELRIVEGSLPVDGRFEFEPDANGGTRLELFATGRPAGAMRLMQPLLKLAVRHQFAGYLRTLKSVMEQPA